MVLISKSKRYFIKQHGYGLRNITYKTIDGNGVFRDCLRNLGKFLFSGSKKMFNYIKPRAITFHKDTAKDIKPKLEKMAIDESTKVIHDLMNKPREIRETSEEIIKEIKNDVKEEIIPKIKENLVKSYFDLIKGKEISRTRQRKTNNLSKKSKDMLKILTNK